MSLSFVSFSKLLMGWSFPHSQRLSAVLFTAFMNLL